MHNVPLGDYHIYLNASNQTKIKKNKIKNLGLNLQKTKDRGEGGKKILKNLAKVPPRLKGLLVKC